MPGASYSVATVRQLEIVFEKQKIHRPLRVERYEQGTLLDYVVRGVIPDGRARVKLETEEFVGGGFAGQVYKVKLLEGTVLEGSLPALETGRSYALKIFVPASGFSRRIRNIFYGMGFQAPFSLQAIPAAGRSQALWQKFIRRAAKIEFGTEDAVADIHATFVDPNLGSCGELSEWVAGRQWRFEVDDDLDARRAWKPGRPDGNVGSPEYRAKREFMARLVRLMHRLGAFELARQYEWWSLKSQPNALKRTSSDPNPKSGLVAVDFRAGMTVTPATPQSPVDVKLIFQGLGRGRLVQFDKGDVRKLAAYVAAHPEEFADMRDTLGTLTSEDRRYRDSLIDVTYHHLRLFGRKLRRSAMAAFRQGWRIRNVADERTSARLEKNGLASFAFLLVPFLGLATPVLYVFAWPGRHWWLFPAWALPLFAPFLRRLWGRADLRRHYGNMLTSARYIFLAGRARSAEALIRWIRSGRVSEARALRLGGAPLLFYAHLPLSWLPPGLHRFLTDKVYFRDRLRALFVQPVRLFVHPAERERWLLRMIGRGEDNRMLTSAEAGRIRGQIQEPFIQKYLKSMAVHLATLFVSETVYVTVALVYVLTHTNLTWQQATLHSGLIVAALNLLPFSPGSLVRGFYVIGLMLRERNFRDYSIAVGISFLKMLGYLAFPIQMAYRYPDLARFMASHWATDAVHRVPVFGEKGAWLEHFAFDAFYNYPLTLRRRIRERAARRKDLRARRWPGIAVSLGGAAVLTALFFGYRVLAGRSPSFGDFWWLAIWVPLLGGALTARWAGGLLTRQRVFLGMFVGAAIGLFYGMCSSLMVIRSAAPGLAGANPGLALARSGTEFLLLFGLLSIIGALIAETRKLRSKKPPCRA